MPKKFAGQNSKAVAAKERKEQAKEEKNAKLREEQERKATAEWSVGSRKSREDEERKKEEKAKRKQEAAALLAKEEKELAKYKPVKSATSSTEKKKPSYSPFASTPKPQIPSPTIEPTFEPTREDVESYSASGLENALDLLHLTVNNSTASISLDRHPERRAKAAWLAFKDRELPQFKKDNPGLKLSQMNDRLWKIWQKSPENPFNQGVLAFNATMEDEQEAAYKRKGETLHLMRTH